MDSNYKPQREEEILAFWKKEKIFEKSLEQTKGNEPFVFYDGPPFATGQPHYGHMLPSTLKDIIPRYQTMKGKYVARRWGWDCHGLPVENLIEKEFGLNCRKDILEFGLAKFNDAARKSVLRYAHDWKQIIPRMGRFVDMENDYKTMDASYTESVWSAFAKIHDKDLMYEGFKSMYICPRCETNLSNFEVNQGYKDITDISVYVKFELEDEPNVFMLAWTTTPWTLPGNTAIAVNKEVDYIKVKIKEKENDTLILAKERAEHALKAYEYEVVEELKGSKLVGKKYKPVFDTYKDETLPHKENIWKIWNADFVTITDGTGVVHIAPGFGEDDLKLSQTNNIPFVQHVGINGRFKDNVIGFAGMKVKPIEDSQLGDIEIIKYLAKHGTLFAKEKIIHSYPHCWRCQTPLLNFATTSWFVKVSSFKDKLLEENKNISWIPKEIGENRFGNWLEGARDWAISRARFWGAPIPVWKSEDEKHIRVVKSIDDLRTLTKRNNYLMIRHGEAENNVENILSSKKENPHSLTKKGKEEVKKDISMLKAENIHVIFASPFVRTTETADILKEELGFKGEIIFDERISEQNFGEYDGRTIVDYDTYLIEEEEKGRDRMEIGTPGGENRIEVKKRVAEFLYDVDQKYSGKNILFVTHQGIMLSMIIIARGGRKSDINEVRKEFSSSLVSGEVVPLKFSSLPHNEFYEVDLHRPYIDEIAFTINEKGKDILMKRVPDVFDCWFESGSMPYASKHFICLEDNTFPPDYPAAFISEGVDQTRGWFYSLLVLGIVLFGKSPYQHVSVNGLILAEDGRKMSKSLNNYPPLLPTIEKYGADSLRFFLASSPASKGEETLFSEKSLEDVIKKNFNRLFNILSLYEMSIDGEQKREIEKWTEGEIIKSPNVLDQWVLALLQTLINDITSALDGYYFDRALRSIAGFIDDLSLWYVRRSRDRYKGEDKEDKLYALATTRFVLVTFSKILAPFTPFLAEDLFLKLKHEGDKESVHLTSWPSCDQSKAEQNALLLHKMSEVRKIVSLTLEARAKAGMKVRQPLARVMLREDPFDISNDEGYLSLIKDEVNVKDVILDSEIAEDVLLDITLTPELIKEGEARELMRFIQDMRKKAGLSPSDFIVLSIETNQDGADIIDTYRKEIMRTVRAGDILLEDLLVGEELKTEKTAFKVFFKKL